MTVLLRVLHPRRYGMAGGRCQCLTAGERGPAGGRGGGRDPRARARPGQEIGLAIDVDRLHVFDPETQAAIDKIDVPEELRVPQGG